MDLQSELGDLLSGSDMIQLLSPSPSPLSSSLSSSLPSIYMHSTCGAVTTQNMTTTSKLEADVTKTVRDNYYTMLWWRHFCKTNKLNWITTSDERRLGKEALSKGIPIPSHADLQRKYGKYDSDFSSSDDDTIDASDCLKRKIDTLGQLK